MINIMIQISAYIFTAIVLGYFFGWLVTKIFLKQKYQDRLDEILAIKSVNTEELKSLNDELFKYKKDNKSLRAANKEVSLGYEGQKYVLQEHNTTLDEFQNRLLRKDEIIGALTKKLVSTEEKLMSIEKKYEEEIDAFMFERIEITKKYKDLLINKDKFKQRTAVSENKETWFSKFFSLPSNAY